MARSKAGIEKRQDTPAQPQVARVPRCLEISEQGIVTANDFTAFMSALMSDVIEGVVPPSIANASVNAGGKMLKCAEMQMKYGAAGKSGRRVLNLVSPVIAQPIRDERNG